MQVTIEITEGCTNYSYLINGKEWMELIPTKCSNEGDIDLVNRVCEKLIYEAEHQYNLPTWIVGYLWDGEDETYCTQDTFVKLVRNNNRTTLEDLGHCDECGDDIERMTLKLEL